MPQASGAAVDPKTRSQPTLCEKGRKVIYKNNSLSSLHDIPKHYLTQSINTDVKSALVAQGPIVNFTGQSEEEVIAFRKAIELAYILI